MCVCGKAKACEGERVSERMSSWLPYPFFFGRALLSSNFGCKSFWSYLEMAKSKRRSITQRKTSLSTRQRTFPSSNGLCRHLCFVASKVSIVPKDPFRMPTASSLLPIKWTHMRFSNFLSKFLYFSTNTFIPFLSLTPFASLSPFRTSTT